MKVSKTICLADTGVFVLIYGLAGEPLGCGCRHFDPNQTLPKSSRSITQPYLAKL